ncbi:MAG: methylenetetrahydrofolate reductase C-terminal domain-containing protein [Verrucomicrobiota bacterium]|nr:methylenetetrahydrofolate reductase C-terminal domain-containing protein [Verrucomicrobiota bacterium]
MERVYGAFMRVLVWTAPLLRLLGYERIERPVATVERRIKGFLFDCQMCGQCVLTVTGISCPMNCPKNLRNGPCGGVRADGMCEVDAEMRCVWVEAWAGSQRMRNGAAIKSLEMQPLDNRLLGKSSWLREIRAATMYEETSSPNPGQ